MITDMHEQGSEGWWNARKGIPSASNFSRIMTPKKCTLSAQADEYICELIGDVCGTLLPPYVENYTNSAIRWGQQTEAEARRFYSLETSLDVQQVGFITTDDGRFGCSPDGLIGDDGGLEIKCPLAKTHTSYLLAGEVVPDDYKPQVHGAMIVTGRKWWDWLSYCPGMSPVLVRTIPDDYTDKLRAALDDFYPRYQAALALVRGEPAAPDPTAEAAAAWKKRIDGSEDDDDLNALLREFMTMPKDRPERKAVWQLFTAFAAQHCRKYSPDSRIFVPNE